MSERVLSAKSDRQSSIEEVINPLQPVSDALARVFQTRQEENSISQARRIMGNCLNSLSDEEIEVFIVEFQYLLDEWLDGFERQSFGGKTLRQMLAQD